MPFDPGKGESVDRSSVHIQTAGGTAGGVCWIGGADETAVVQSLTERVAALERALALIIGGDISAGQLSDISQQMGWVYGIEYMGIPGWIRTAAGTLIPPAGVTFHDMGLGSLVDYPCNPFDAEGNLKPGLRMSVYDEEGNLTFGTDCSGGLHGTQVDAWNAGVTPEADYATIIRTSSGFGDVSDSRNMTIGTSSTGTTSTNLRVTPGQTGLYFMALYFNQQVNLATTIGFLQSTLQITNGSGQVIMPNTVQATIPSGAGLNAIKIDGTLTGVVAINSLTQIVANIATTTASCGGTLGNTNSMFSLFRISS